MLIMNFRSESIIVSFIQIDSDSEAGPGFETPAESVRYSRPDRLSAAREAAGPGPPEGRPGGPGREAGSRRRAGPLGRHAGHGADSCQY
jgi:hypothetical protein